MALDKERVLPIIKAALKEDIGRGDITSSAIIGKFASSGASVVVKEDCVVCGLKVAEWLMAAVDYSVRFKPNCDEGSSVGAGKEIIFLEGHALSILRAERTMLNFLALLSGVATLTSRFAQICAPYGVKVMDTRKTLPLLRYLEKYAVSTGGGSNHRMGLYDQVLIKDNHIRLQVTGYRLQEKKKSLKGLVELARKNNVKGTRIEIEVTSVEEFTDAIEGAPDIIMLDNMPPRSVKSCVEVRRLSRLKPIIEVSGGITLDDIEEYAKTRVDIISVGSLTSSVKSIDMSLEIV